MKNVIMTILNIASFMVWLMGIGIGLPLIVAGIYNFFVELEIDFLFVVVGLILTPICLYNKKIIKFLYNKFNSMN